MSASEASCVVSVVVPSYHRPDDLRRCLEAMTAQVRPADEVLVVAREDDGATREAALAFAARLPVSVVAVAVAGQVAALNAGRGAARGDVIAITDDDARPVPGWLAAIERRFLADPGLGAVGGPDVVHGVPRGDTELVGRVQWFGRSVGNHHLRAVRQDVDFLKGANMAFRRDALKEFDSRLLGAGAQVCNDLDVSLAARHAGWRVLYDPAVEVDHHPAPRHDDDARGTRTSAAARAEYHNETYVLLRHLPVSLKLRAVGFRLLVGTRGAPGLLLAPAAGRWRTPGQAISLVAAIARARLAGARTYLSVLNADRGRPRRREPARPPGG